MVGTRGSERVSRIGASASPELPAGRGSDAWPREGWTMKTHSTMTLPSVRDVLAPDGSEVRVLLSLAGGGMAHFLLPAGEVARAVHHRTVEEIWYVLSGEGEMWLSANGCGEIARLSSGTCLTIPAGNIFQFRSTGNGPLTVIAVTMPPWPGDGEAEIVRGKWQPTVGGGR